MGLLVSGGSLAQLLVIGGGGGCFSVEECAANGMLSLVSKQPALLSSVELGSLYSITIQNLLS